MKPTAIIAALAVVCVAAFAYTPARVLWDHRTREQARRSMMMQTTPFVPDPVTRGILDGADRVETFRLDDFHEGESRTAAEAQQADRLRARGQLLDDHAVLHQGQSQRRAFAAALGVALGQVRIPTSSLKALMPSCFDPGVGYRVWKGKAHTDLCVCFYCAGIEMITKDAQNKVVTQTMMGLGAARPAFLALSQQAFPKDKDLAALKTS